MSLHDDTFIRGRYTVVAPEIEEWGGRLRNNQPDDEVLRKIVSEGVQHVFDEDHVLLNKVQKGMSNKIHHTSTAVKCVSGSNCKR